MQRIAVVVGVLLSGCGCVFALNPSLDISQYAHTAWTARDGHSLGNIYSMTQTPDGYLWLGGEFGLFRFDGVHTTKIQTPDSKPLKSGINRVLGAHDGTVWIGTFYGLATWSGGKLTQRPEFEGQVIDSLLEDRKGTVWVGPYDSPNAKLCAIRNGGTECYGDGGAFGTGVRLLYEDGSGNLWAGTQSGIWRVKPGPLKRYAAPPHPILPWGLSGLNISDDGQLLIAMYGSGLMRVSGNRFESYPIRDAVKPNRVLQDRDVNANKLLRDRDGGLWIGTVERGLIHVHHGRTDVFTRSDGLSGNVVLSLFEDREGNVWVATTGGLDRFAELAVTTTSVKQGLSSEASQSVLATKDGTVWIGTHDGLNRWNDGHFTVLRKDSGLPDSVQSLFQDGRGRIWVSTEDGRVFFKDGRFVGVPSIPRGLVHFISGDNAGNIWLSAEKGLLHLLDGRLVEQISWAELGHPECCAEVLLSGSEPGGVWVGFWADGGMAYVKDGKVRKYSVADGLGAGHVPDLRIDSDGALWAATEDGGVSRLKDGRIATLSTRNGLPCNTIHWTIESDDSSVWMYTACGIVRISRTELDAWIADPNHRIITNVWDAADGVKLRPLAATAYGPRVTKTPDEKLWFLTGEGVQVMDIRHLAANKIAPPVRIEQIKADGKPYQIRQGMRLPANVRDVSIDYTALSLVAPEKVHFKYMLEGQDLDWKEVINDRDAQYSNLAPRNYRFRVIASNNSGVWNMTGDTLEFSVDPRYYQTAWFSAACLAGFVGIVVGLHRLRLHRLAREFNARIEERVQERTRIARELHDTLLQSFQGLMFSFQAARNLLPGRTEDAIRTLDGAIHEGDAAIAEGRNAIQALRATPGIDTTLEQMLTAAGKELARSSGADGHPPAFEVTVEGTRQRLSPVLQDDVYRIAREVLRNAFHHAHARRVEAEIVYDRQFFRLRIRDNGRGIDRNILDEGSRQGHWGLPGVRERAKRIDAEFKLWSELGAGTEAELTVPARIAYGTLHGRNGLRFS